MAFLFPQAVLLLSRSAFIVFRLASYFPKARANLICRLTPCDVISSFARRKGRRFLLYRKWASDAHSFIIIPRVSTGTVPLSRIKSIKQHKSRRSPASAPCCLSSSFHWGTSLEDLSHFEIRNCLQAVGSTPCTLKAVHSLLRHSISVWTIVLTDRRDCTYYSLLILPAPTAATSVPARIRLSEILLRFLSMGIGIPSLSKCAIRARVAVSPSPFKYAAKWRQRQRCVMLGTM